MQCQQPGPMEVQNAQTQASQAGEKAGPRSHAQTHVRTTRPSRGEPSPPSLHLRPKGRPEPQTRHSLPALRVGEARTVGSGSPEKGAGPGGVTDRCSGTRWAGARRASREHQGCPGLRNRFVRRHNWSVKSSSRCVGCPRQVCERWPRVGGGQRQGSERNGRHCQPVGTRWGAGRARAPLSHHRLGAGVARSAGAG